MDFLNQTVNFKCFDGADMTTYIATPKSEGPRPAIIIVHEAWGLNEQIKGVANRFAQHGFVGVAPHLFSRDKDLTEQAIEKAMMRMWQIPPEKRGDPATVQALMASLPEDERKIMNFFFTGRENAEKAMVQDLLRCINYVKTLEAIDGKRLGLA
jgi:carboxymethylenebutenolidase